MTPADLRALRLALGLTQREFAARLPVGYATLRDWEAGRAPVPPLALHRLDAIRRAAKLPAALPPAPMPRPGRPRKEPGASSL